MSVCRQWSRSRTKTASHALLTLVRIGDASASFILILHTPSRRQQALYVAQCSPPTAQDVDHCCAVCTHVWRASAAPAVSRGRICCAKCSASSRSKVWSSRCSCCGSGACSCAKTWASATCSAGCRARSGVQRASREVPYWITASARCRTVRARAHRVARCTWWRRAGICVSAAACQTTLGPSAVLAPESFWCSIADTQNTGREKRRSSAARSGTSPEARPISTRPSIKSDCIRCSVNLQRAAAHSVSVLSGGSPKLRITSLRCKISDCVATNTSAP
mmetsp:Transcript_4480/g.9395  ORF Transcript_4480/g.9395 Transcript_4480/m.9395 type:complete len:277 (-) Transcript_4480:276-1106(-)